VASASSTGATASWTSRRVSTRTPPRPARITGPSPLAFVRYRGVRDLQHDRVAEVVRGGGRCRVAAQGGLDHGIPVPASSSRMAREASGPGPGGTASRSGGRARRGAAGAVATMSARGPACSEAKPVVSTWAICRAAADRDAARWCGAFRAMEGGQGRLLQQGRVAVCAARRHPADVNGHLHPCRAAWPPCPGQPPPPPATRRAARALDHHVDLAGTRQQLDRGQVERSEQAPRRRPVGGGSARWRTRTAAPATRPAGTRSAPARHI
jgi:hypothetical protein